MSTLQSHVLQIWTCSPLMHYSYVLFLTCHISPLCHPASLVGTTVPAQAGDTVVKMHNPLFGSDTSPLGASTLLYKQDTLDAGASNPLPD